MKRRTGGAELLLHREIESPAGFSSLVAFGVAPSGNALTTWATTEGAARLTRRSDDGPNAPSFPMPSPQEPVDVAVVEHLRAGEVVTVLRGIS